MVNYDYYGTEDTWSTATTTGAGTISVKIPTITNQTEDVIKGSFQYLWGKEFASTGNYDVTKDTSFCFLAMDKDAPQNKVRLSSGCISSSAALSERYGLVDVIPTKNVSFGFSLNGDTSPADENFQIDNVYNYTTWGKAPVNYKPLFLSPTWVPENGKYSDSWYLRYFAFQCAPVLSWTGYKEIKLVPLIFCGALKEGKDPAEISSYSDIYATFENLGVYDLKTYLNGTTNYGGETIRICERNQYVFQIGCMPVKINFTDGTASSYSLVDGGSVSSGKGYLYPTSIFDENFLFAKQYKANPSSYGAEIEGNSGDFSFFRARVSYDYVFNSYHNTPGNIQSVISGYSGHWVVSGVTTIQDYYSGRENMTDEIFDPDFWNVIEINVGGNAYTGSIFAFTYLSVPDFGETEFREYVRKILAYYGLFFTDGYENDIPENEEMTTTGVFLGTVDSGGITHGDYTEGTDNPNNDNYEWNDPIHDTPYTPGGGEEDTEYPSDPLLLNTYAENGFNLAANYYALRRTDIDDLTNWINWYMSYENAESAAESAGDPYETVFHTKYPTPADWYAYVCTMAGFGVHPNNDIISLMAFPFEISGTDAGYVLGSWETNVYHNYFQELPDTVLLTGKKITGNGYEEINLGSGTVTFPGVKGDFRDYAPYTRLELQIPFHGTVSLDTGEWLGKTISVTAICDIMTGSSLAVICRNGSPVITIPGQMGVSVPISIDNISQTANSFTALSCSVQSGMVNTVNDILQGVARSVAGVAGAVTSGITGDIPGVVSGAMSTLSTEWGAVARTAQNAIEMKQNLYDMNHTVNGKLVSGGGSPSTNARYETKCRLVWHYPQILPNSGGETFTDIAGHSCNISDTIENFHGFVQFGAVDLSGVSATDTEKQEILSFLQTGVFI